MNKKVIVLLFLMSFVNCFSRFYTIKSEIELRQKMKEFVVVLLCFTTDDDRGKYIKKIMKDLSADDEYNENSDNYDKFAFLWIPVEQDSLKKIGQQLGYKGEPLFVLYDTGKPIATTEISSSYSVRLFKKFIEDKVGNDIYDPKIDDEIDRDGIFGL